MNLTQHLVQNNDQARFNRLQDEVYKPTFDLIARAGGNAPPLLTAQAMGVAVLFILGALWGMETMGFGGVAWASVPWAVGPFAAVGMAAAVTYAIQRHAIRREATALWVTITLSFPYAMEADDWCLQQLRKIAYD